MTFSSLFWIHYINMNIIYFISIWKLVLSLLRCVISSQHKPHYKVFCPCLNIVFNKTFLDTLVLYLLVKYKCLFWLIVFGKSDFISISIVLPYLRKADSCVLMVYCTYFRLYGKLPKAIVGRL